METSNNSPTKNIKKKESNLSKQANQAWENKLVPCSKNKYISEKLKKSKQEKKRELDMYRTLNSLQSKLMNNNNSIISNNILITNQMNETNEEENFNSSILVTDNSTNLRWKQQIQEFENNSNNININFNDQSEVPKDYSKHTPEISMLSYNLEDINNYIEENYNMIISENSFLRKEFHSIILLLLISSTEIHRISLSDYEIKMIEKDFINKAKINRLDGMNYYRLGLISFYQGRYNEAFARFYKAKSLRNNNSSITKWFALSGMIVVLGDKGKLLFTNSSFNSFNLETNSSSFSYNTISNNLNFNNTKKHKHFNSNTNNINNINIENNNEQDIENDELREKEKSSYTDNFLFSCCSVRKDKIANKISVIKFSTTTNSLFMDSYTNDYYINTLSNYLSFDVYLTKIEIFSEIEESLLSLVLNKEKKINYINEKDIYEGWWLIMILSNFKETNSKYAYLLKNITYTEKYCIKKIQEYDQYMSYLAYLNNIEINLKENYYNCEDNGIANNLLIQNKSKSNNYMSHKSSKSGKNGSVNKLKKELYESEELISNILSELIIKYPFKFEAYLKFWFFLSKYSLTHKNLDKACHISELLWKSCFKLNFDDLSNYLYVFYIYAKSLFLKEQYTTSAALLQKEYPTNFLYPSLLFLFGKYSAKSNLRNLKICSISSLQEAYKLLASDLQFNCLYWIGYVYWTLGAYNLSYDYWKTFKTNAEITSNCLYFSKLHYIDNCVSKDIEILCESFYVFQTNLKKLKLVNPHFFFSNNKQDHNSTSFSRLQYSQTTHDNQELEINEHTLSDYLNDLEKLITYEPNLKFNRSTTYEYYRGYIIFLINKDIDKALEICINLIDYNKSFYPAIKIIWKIIKLHFKDEKLLLKFSLLAIHLTFNSEVTTDDWLQVYLLYSKALMLNRKLNDALDILRNLLDLFAIINLDNLAYLNQIYKANKKTSTNNLLDLDYILSFYSRSHVYNKCEDIFILYHSDVFNNKYHEDDLNNSFDFNKASEKLIIKENKDKNNDINDENRDDKDNEVSVDKIITEVRNGITNKNKSESQAHNLNVSGISNYLYNENDESIDNINISKNSILITDTEKNKEDNDNENMKSSIKNDSIDDDNYKGNDNNESNMEIEDNNESIDNIRTDKSIKDCQQSSINNNINETNIINKSIKNKRPKMSIIECKDLKINSVEKLTMYVDQKLKTIDISSTENLFITVVSNIEILYLMGKFCCRDYSKTELGILCMKDYVRLLKFQNNYNLNDESIAKLYKAYFYLGVLNCQLGAYEQTKKNLDKIYSLELLEYNKQRVLFIRMFNEFNKRRLRGEVEKMNLSCFDFSSV